MKKVKTYLFKKGEEVIFREKKYKISEIFCCDFVDLLRYMLIIKDDTETLSIEISCRPMKYWETEPGAYWYHPQSMFMRRGYEFYLVHRCEVYNRKKIQKDRLVSTPLGVGIVLGDFRQVIKCRWTEPGWRNNIYGILSADENRVLTFESEYIRENIFCNSEIEEIFVDEEVYQEDDIILNLTYTEGHFANWKVSKEKESDLTVNLSHLNRCGFIHKEQLDLFLNTDGVERYYRDIHPSIDKRYFENFQELETLECLIREYRAFVLRKRKDIHPKSNDVVKLYIDELGKLFTFRSEEEKKEFYDLYCSLIHKLNMYTWLVD